ncbi:MAG: metallophosphoesterase [Vallitalea sp.]|jgi:putative phosphoesterase|nr:metallophosphoesterase [Vallitalea sp.]
MKILVISDTHGNLSNVIKIINTIKDLDRIIHLGDNEKDAEELEFSYNYPIDYVIGNCDFNSPAPQEKILEFYGQKILITHGHYYNVKWEYDTILKAAINKNVNVILFGHTHVSMMKSSNGVTLFNPGSISLPRDGKGPSFGVLEIEDNGKIHFTTKKIKKK